MSWIVEWWEKPLGKIHIRERRRETASRRRDVETILHSLQVFRVNAPTDIRVYRQIQLEQVDGELVLPERESDD